MPTIELEHVSKYYKADKHGRTGRRMEVGVEDVCLTIEQGEFVFVIGSSGAGKSTLLNLISGQIRPSRGVVRLGGKNVSGSLLRRGWLATQFGRVTQAPSLIRKMTVEENLTAAARAGRKFKSAKDLNARVAKVVRLVGMSGSEKKYPVEMSVGECRRIELARALINSPPILTLDEITANLNDGNIWDIFHLLQEINRRGTTVIMATHASEYVNIMRRRVATLVDGRLFGDVKKGRYGDVI